MRDETARPKNEMDILKFYIWLMLVMTVALAVFTWIVMRDVEETRKNLALGRSLVAKDAKDGFLKMQGEIQAMLNVYKSNKEDMARDAPGTWFSSVWRRRQIPDAAMIPGAWKYPARFDTRGKYWEEQIGMDFNRKSPLSRQAIVEFCHEVEKSSTRLRVIELKVSRVDKENFDKDEWYGTSLIGFRHARND